VIAFAKIVFHLHFWVIPVVFFAVGLVSTSWNHKFSLYLFLFLFPFINASPGLFDTQFPYNYMAVPLFLLSGIVVAFITQVVGICTQKGIKDSMEKPNHLEEYLDKDFFPYYLFLLILFISFVFVLLRWSNVTLSSSAAVGADTPVSPPAPGLTSSTNDPMIWNEQRISFASIFPVVSLFIYFISPFIFFYIKKQKPEEGRSFTWISYGFFVSVGIAIIQKIANYSLISDRLGKEFKQFYGGFSDFNAFGFFSGVMFLWATYEIKKKNSLGFVTFLAALAGGILSGSRTVYFFILAGIINLLLPSVARQKKHRKIVIIALIVVVVVLVVVTGGTLRERLREGFSEDESLVKRLDAITNGRVWMTLFTLETIKGNFIPGVGTGNFTFYLAYKNYLPYKLHGQKYLYDLTLNHYLLVFAENGVLAFLFFTFFMIFLFRRSLKKLLIGTILFSLLFNNFFWFPEAFLLFWILAALNDTNKKEIVRKEFFSKKNKKILTGISVLIFVVFNIITFHSLHPKTWAKETRIRYDYGFWYLEKDGAGKNFRWTKEWAGIYISLDKNGESTLFKLVCGAPLPHFKEKKQRVEIYWKGKLYKEITFAENKGFFFKIKSQPLEEGFLEVKVLPSFNLKAMGLGSESRDLGIQFF
jgi:O-antigen ligase